MITHQQYIEAVEAKQTAQKTIDDWFRQKTQEFEKRMKENPVFTLDELFFSRTARCPCGAGLAYPNGCGMHHHWDCSDILMGRAKADVVHTDALPFAFYDVKGERDNDTTRPKQ